MRCGANESRDLIAISRIRGCVSRQNGGVGFCECTASLSAVPALFRFFTSHGSHSINSYLCGNHSFRLNRSKGDLVLGEEFADRFGELSAFTSPVVDAITFEIDGSGFGAGIIGADYLDRTAIAGAILFNDNDAVVGLLTGANARQTNHQHRVDPLKKLECIQGCRQRHWTYS